MLPTVIPFPADNLPESDSLPPLPRLDARLQTALSFVRGGSGTVADVGTDHAYLPVTLLREARCRFAVATDIHRGPAAIAARNLAFHGIGADRAVVLCTDGLHGAEPYHPDDILILGMGGEMIVHVLDEAPLVKNPAVRLILQPMTHPEAVRAYLDGQGFGVIAEPLIRADRVYQIIVAEYDGQRRTHTPLERLIGKQNLDARTPICLEYVARQREICLVSRAGKASAGADTSQEDALLSEIEPYLQNV